MVVVGRREELARLVALLDRGHGGVVLVGDAGMGKTHLALELVRVAEERGLTTRRVTATTGARPVAFGAFASLLPETETHPDARAGVLQSVADALTADTALLLVDDAHLLDEASAAALHLVAGRRRIVLAVTMRAGEPAPDALRALWKDGLADRIDLDPLDEPETRALTVEVAGGPLDGASHRVVWRASRGHPLLVSELVAAAWTTGVLRETNGMFQLHGDLPTSPRLEELVDARLAGLTAAERDAVELLAVAGDLGLATLASMADATALEALERRRLIDVGRDGRRLPVRLGHPIYGERVRAGLDLTARAALTRRLADALEVTGARRAGDLVRLAIWRLEGGAARPDLMVQAAQRALFAWDEPLAVRLATAARLSGAGVAADLVESQALIQLGRDHDAAALLRSALTRTSTEEEDLVATSQLANVLFWTMAEDAECLALLEALADRVADEESARQVRGSAAIYDALAGRVAEAVECAERLTEGGEGKPFLTAAVAAGPALTLVGRAGDALALGERAVPARLALGDADAVPDVFKYLVSNQLALGELGRLDEAAALCRHGYELALDVHARNGQAWCSMMIGRTALLSGALATAGPAFAEASALFEELRETGLLRWSLAGRALVAAMTGDAAGAKAAVADLDALPATAVRMLETEVFRAVAWQRATVGDAPGASAALLAAVAEADARGAFGASLIAIHDLARLGDRGAAVGALRDEHVAVQGALAAARVAFVRATDGGALDAASSAFAQLGANLFAAEAAGAAAAVHQLRRRERSLAACRALVARCEGAATPLVRSAGGVELTRRGARGRPLGGGRRGQPRDRFGARPVDPDRREPLDAGVREAGGQLAG